MGPSRTAAVAGTRLDALFGDLGGLSEATPRTSSTSSRGIEKNEWRKFGSYLTKHLVLNQYRALYAATPRPSSPSRPAESFPTVCSA